MPEIVVQDLVLDYSGNRAIDGVSFSVEQGEFLTLLGPSGCGKTSTLMSIAGLAEPTAGVILCGDDTWVDVGSKVRVAAERRDCGVVFQSYAVWPHMTVAENVAYPLKLRKHGKQERARRVAETLDLVELGHLGDRYPHELSGGQQQRVALARAVVYSPSVLLLDEPLSNLDAKLREQARTWLKLIQARLGLSTVLVTHDQDEALSMSDRIVVMNHGRVEQIGTPSEVYQTPNTVFVADFLGSNNLFDAQLSTDDGVSMVELSDGSRLLIPTGAVGEHQPGPVTVMLRSERIGIEALGDAADDPATLTGTVIARMFLGSRFRYQVDVGGQRVAVDTDRDIDDVKVTIRVPADGCRLLPAR